MSSAYWYAYEKETQKTQLMLRDSARFCGAKTCGSPVARATCTATAVAWQPVQSKLAATATFEASNGSAGECETFVRLRT